MKIILLGATALAAVAMGLGGCASTGTSSMARRSSAPTNYEVDLEKVATVNQWAHRRGYGVEWINLPYKPRELASKDN